MPFINHFQLTSWAVYLPRARHSSCSCSHSQRDCIEYKHCINRNQLMWDIESVREFYSSFGAHQLSNNYASMTLSRRSADLPNRMQIPLNAASICSFEWFFVATKLPPGPTKKTKWEREKYEQNKPDIVWRTVWYGVLTRRDVVKIHMSMPFIYMLGSVYLFYNSIWFCVDYNLWPTADTHI